MVSRSISRLSAYTTLSFTVLVRYRTRTIFRLGGTCPPPSSTATSVDYSINTRVSEHKPTGLSPSTELVPRDFGSLRPASGISHISFRIRFGLFPFRSPLVRESRLLSFPASTGMFSFGAFPYRHSPAFPTSLSGGKSHSGIHGSMPARGSP